MLAKLKMEIQGEGLHSNMGSLFHGYLMENIDPDFAQYLHYNQINPYTSALIRDKSGAMQWRITTVNQLAYEMLIKPYVDNPIEHIFLQQKNQEIKVMSTQVQRESIDNLYQNATRPLPIHFLTPTSYKSGGKTHIFPEIKTLLEGVINKINQFSDTIKLSDEKILQELLGNVQIKDYSLRTQIFHMEQIRIKGFVGKIEVGLYPDRTLEQLLSFLVGFSEYTGLGIKTALGMGAISLEKEKPRR